MSDDDHAEEQEMEAEALAAIFDTHFQASSDGDQKIWTIELYPHVGDDEPNHVACKLIVTLPRDYPTVVPLLKVELLQGLAHDEHGPLLQSLADDEATANEGGPSVFAICERLRDWLMENNVRGLDDQSMHAQMLRKQQQQSKQAEKPALAFESQTVQEEFTQAELEELQVRKRREEGTPCNKENFERWKLRFEKEMDQAREALEELDDNKKNKKAKEERSSRQTGYQLFAANMNLEALEAAAENAQVDEAEENLEEVDEDLFQEDIDLDDLDFDSDEGDEEDDDDEEDQVDI